MDASVESLCILFLIDAFFIFAGVVVLSVVREILRWIPSRLLRAGIILGILAVGFLYLSRADTPTLLTGALAFVPPMAALVPLYLVDRGTGNDPGYSRIILCDLLVSAAGAVLLFFFDRSGLTMMPVVYWHTPVSNGMFYILAFLLCLAGAALVYVLMQQYGNRAGQQNTG